MPSYEELRAQLVTRIRATDEARRDSQVAGDCEHQRQRFKQTVLPDNPRFTGAGAVFIVSACTKCKQKELIDYEIVGLKP
jgi:hypothetical protein